MQCVGFGGRRGRNEQVRVCAGSLRRDTSLVPASLPVARVRNCSASTWTKQEQQQTIAAAAAAAAAAAHQSTASMAILEQPGVLQTLQLANGRRVSYSDCGDPGGHPVIFLHPIQGNRYMGLVMHEPAAQHGMRIIALDRPGVGESSPAHGRSVASYAQDVAQVANHLNLAQFSVLAMSAGTMYALALTLAPETQHRVVGKVTLLAPWIPHSSRRAQRGSWLTWAASALPLPLLQAVVGFGNNRIVQQARHKPVTELMTRSNEQEKAAFAADPHADAVYKQMIQLWPASLGGIMQEMALCTERQQRLHFRYATCVSAPVRVFIGTADAMLAHEHVQHWAADAQHANVEVISVQGGTHDGLIHTHKTAALEALARDVRSSGGGSG